MSKSAYIYVFIVIVLVAAAAFYAGVIYKGASLSSMTIPSSSAGSNITYATSAVGTIVSHSLTNITLKLSDGSTQTYVLSSSTQVIAPTTAGQQAPTLATLPDNIPASLVLAPAAAGGVEVSSITLAPSWSSASTASTTE